MARALEFPFVRERREFGRQCLFTDRNELLVDYPPNHSLLYKNFILKNPVHRPQNLAPQFALSECNTEIVQLIHRGLLHNEGGWPKDVNANDEEQVLRYRKKIERDEAWGKVVGDLTKPTVSTMFQNTAVNIYEEYFQDIPPASLIQDFTCESVNLFHDCASKPRPVTHLSFSPGGKNFLALHGPLNALLVDEDDYDKESYIWTMDNEISPVQKITGPSLVTIADYCPKDERMMAGGISTGLATLWDLRTGPNPVIISELESAHRNLVSAVIWVSSKSNTEFYTGSPAGEIIWWDTRKMKEPLMEVLLDPVRTSIQARKRVHGCTAMDFEYTIPVRFMAGTDHGYIFIGNRKGFTPNEILVTSFPIMDGPVKSIQRNPAFLKNFLVAGDWCVQMWTEDSKDNPLFHSINNDSEINIAIWSPTRCSLFFVGTEAGTLEFWDLLLDQRQAVYIMSIFKSPITSLVASSNGRYLMVGTKLGDVQLIQLADVLTSSTAKEKSIISSLFDRETKRCKLLEGHMREIKLRLAKEAELAALNAPKRLLGDEEEEEIPEEEEGEGGMEEGEEEEDEEVSQAKQRFFDLVIKEEDHRAETKLSLLLNLTAFDAGPEAEKLKAKRKKVKAMAKERAHAQEETSEDEDEIFAIADRIEEEAAARHAGKQEELPSEPDEDTKSKKEKTKKKAGFK